MMDKKVILGHKTGRDNKDNQRWPIYIQNEFE